MKYIIETINAPIQYLCEMGWTPDRTQATEFSKEVREAWAELHRFPVPDGCWVAVSDEQSATRQHFTTIKLRPVNIRLATTKEWSASRDYDDLNAQVDEFEAALRQWLAKQRILAGPEWAVDLVTEE